MNRMFTQFRYSLEKKVIDLWLKAAIGATGAPTINSAFSKGITSIARTGVGAYTITLQDKYVDLYACDYTLVLASGSPVIAGGVVVRQNNVAATTPTVLVQFVDSTGTAAEIPSGATLLVNMVLKGSTI